VCVCVCVCVCVLRKSGSVYIVEKASACGDRKRGRGSECELRAHARARVCVCVCVRARLRACAHKHVARTPDWVFRGRASTAGRLVASRPPRARARTRRGARDGGRLPPSQTTHTHTPPKGVPTPHTHPPFANRLISFGTRRSRCRWRRAPSMAPPDAQAGRYTTRRGMARGAWLGREGAGRKVKLRRGEGAREGGTEGARAAPSAGGTGPPAKRAISGPEAGR